MDSSISFWAALRDGLAKLRSRRAKKTSVVDALAPPAKCGDTNRIDGCTNREAFHTVCRMLHEKHGRRTPTSPVGTLNRLFKKHLAEHQPANAEDAPELTSDNTWVTRETRPKLDFVGLTRHLKSGPRVTLDGGHPIVIARYRGIDCLLDGNKRCRYWYKTRDTGLHEAYVLIVRE